MKFGCDVVTGLQASRDPERRSQLTQKPALSTEQQAACNACHVDGKIHNNNELNRRYEGIRALQVEDGFDEADIEIL